MLKKEKKIVSFLEGRTFLCHGNTWYRDEKFRKKKKKIHDSCYFLFFLIFYCRKCLEHHKPIGSTNVQFSG